MKEMMEKVGVDRGKFLSWRRSTKQVRREELAKRIKQAFPDLFDGTEVRIISEPQTDDMMREKYMAILEKENERLRLENDRLLRNIEGKVDRLMARLEQT